MTIFRRHKNTSKLQVSRKALAMARLCWLADMLAHYVLPRPPVWIGLIALGVTAATAALVLMKPPSLESEEVIASYTVNLCAPTFAIPDEQQVESPAVEQPQPEPELAKANPEPETASPVSVQALSEPESIVPVADPAAPAVAAVTPEPEPAAATNTLAAVEIAESAPPVIPTPAASDITDSGKAIDDVQSGGQAAGSQGGESGEVMKRYWLSVRDAVARKLVYPYRARSRGIEGRIVISLTLDKDGRVIKAESLSSDADEDFKMAAVRGVMRAAPFEAPQLAMGESTVTAELPIQFTLVSGGSTPN